MEQIRQWGHTQKKVLAQAPMDTKYVSQREYKKWHRCRIRWQTAIWELVEPCNGRLKLHEETTRQLQQWRGRGSRARQSQDRSGCHSSASSLKYTCMLGFKQLKEWCKGCQINGTSDNVKTWVFIRGEVVDEAFKNWKKAQTVLGDSRKGRLPTQQNWTILPFNEPLHTAKEQIPLPGAVSLTNYGHEGGSSDSSRLVNCLT